MLRLLPLLACLVLVPSPATAVLLEFAYSLEVTGESEFNTGPTLLAVGTEIHGTFRVDSETPAYPGDGRFDWGVTKASYSIPLPATLSVAGYDFQPASGHGLRIFDDHECDDPIGTTCFPERTAPTDEFDFGIGTDLVDPGTGTTIDLSVRVRQIGPAPTFLDSLAIPVTLPDLSEATETSSSIFMWLPGAEQSWVGFAEVTALTVETVPEPGPLGLLAAAVAAAAWMRRGARRA